MEEILKRFPQAQFISYREKKIFSNHSTTTLSHKQCIFYILTSKFWITSHLPLYKMINIIRPSQYIFYLWHGMPIKKIAFLNNTKEKPIQRHHPFLNRKNSLFFVSSDIYRYIFKIAFDIKLSQIQTTGQPRELIFKKTASHPQLKKQYDKIILYAPTFSEQANQNIQYPFEHLNQYNLQQLIQFLEKKNYLFINCFHPLEEDQLAQTLSPHTNKYFQVMTTSTFSQLGYKSSLELLPSCDLMITDYTSMYLDFLLIDQPIIFFRPHHSYYKKARGLIFQNQDPLFTPGPTISSQKELIEQIQECFTNDRYKKERKVTQSLIYNNIHTNPMDNIEEIIRKIK